MLVEDIFEEEGEFWTEVSSSLIFINVGSYQGNRVQVVDDTFHTCIDVSSGAEF